MISLLLTMTLLHGAGAMIAPDMNADGSATPENRDLDMPSQMPATTLPGKWLSSFDEAKKLAESQQVPLIVHFEASWCGPCRQMEASVLSQQLVLEQLSTDFVGVRVDADRHSDLISRFGIASLPTEIILLPGGKETARYVGVASLSSYVSRLQRISTNSVVAKQETEVADESSASDDKLRSCLIVQHDGKMVGLGGFSPVALVTSKLWEKGSEQHVAAFEGVDYFFRSATEKEQFLRAPQEYVPRLHGCDPVELARKNRAEAGAIEYGAFYKGQLYFFSSLKNRQQFQSNPEWYAEGIATDSVKNEEEFPFLRNTTLQ